MNASSGGAASGHQECGERQNLRLLTRFHNGFHTCFADLTLVANKPE